MANLKVYRLTAIGPATAYASVQSDSVRFLDGLGNVTTGGQNISPELVATVLQAQAVEWTESQVRFGGYTAVSAFGMHFRDFDSTGGDGTTNLSIVQNGKIIPMTVTASKGQPATTTCRCIFIGGAATVGTTSKDAVTATDTYTLGATTFNSAALAGIDSQEINIGIDPWTDAGQSGVLTPANVIIRGLAPVATITTTDLGIVSAYLSGTTLASGALVMKFAKVSGSGNGYQYTVPKAYVVGRLNGGNPATGTLTIVGLKGAGAILTGATY